MSSVKENLKSNIIKIKEFNRQEKEKNKFIKDWKEIMYQTNTMNAENKTFTFTEINIESYGFTCDIIPPKGLNFDMLEKLRPTIENNMGCMFVYQKIKFTNKIKAKFIFKGFMSIEFKIPKVNPFEIYIGNSADGKPVIIDMRDYPHIMLSGANGSGKSRLLDLLLTTLICNCNPQEVQLYLVQLAKNDLVIYEDCVHCYAFCDNLKKTNIMLDYIISKMDEISDLIKPLRKAGKGSDIGDYNRLNPQNKLPVRYIIFDEYASITDTSNDNKEVKALKEQIVGKIERVSQYGRALGIFQCVCLQRCVATMLSPFVKSQSNLRISGKQNNMKSSEVAMDDPYVALDLERRVFVFKTYDYDYIKTPTINDKIILDNIKPFLKPNHRTLFSDLEKLNKNSNAQSKNNNSNNSKRTSDTTGKVEKSTSQATTQQETVSVFDAIPKDNILKNSNDVSKDKTKNQSTQPKIIIPTLVYDNVDPNIILEKENKRIEAILKIPNFVPYMPIDIKKVKVVDQTKLNLSEIKTEKPVKEEGRIKKS